MNTEVIIIGAGISGLSAAKVFQNNGIDFIMFEGSNKIGGRAQTEKLAKNHWFDIGASYLHEGNLNPFTKIANQIQFPIENTLGDMFLARNTKLYQAGEKVSDQKFDEFIAEDLNIKSAMEVSAKEVNDMTVCKSINLKREFGPIFWHLLANNNAADPDKISVKDVMETQEGPDYPIPLGLGTLIKLWGASVPVKLNTKVLEVKNMGNFFSVKTSKGLVTTKKILVTVSTAILANGKIKFYPEIPGDKLKALDNLPMGVLNKIGILFKNNTFNDIQSGWYVTSPKYSHKNDLRIGSFELRASSFQTVTVFVGGKLGKVLENRGSAEMFNYALSKLQSIFGTKIRERVINSITTSWSNNEFTLGSYSYAKPGGHQFRKLLSEPIDNKIFFAGEATSRMHYGTCHGAFFSGVRAANEIVTIIK